MTVLSRAAGERGSATVWVVALAGVLAAIGVAAVLVGAAVVDVAVAVPVRLGPLGVSRAGARARAGPVGP